MDVIIGFVNFELRAFSGAWQEFWCPLHVNQEYIEDHLSAVDVEATSDATMRV